MLSFAKMAASSSEARQRSRSRVAALSRLALRAFYRVQFYLDFYSLYQLLRFRGLREEYYRSLWHRAAKNISADITQWGGGYHRIDKDGATTLVKQGSVMLDDHLMLDIMGNKVLTHVLLREIGCPVPASCAYDMPTVSRAEAFAAEHGYPLVVKPASGTGGGRGVTTGVTGRSSLRKASRLAARFDDELLVEKQIDGHSFRLLYLGGRFVDAIRRDPPVIVGDGRRTIGSLLRLETERRLRERPITALSPLKLDRDCINRLAALGLSRWSRLAAGRAIEVKRAANENTADRNHRVSESVHPETLALGALIARRLGVEFAGIDLICKDISEPLSPDNGCINEINTTPGIHHHYLVSQPEKAVPVAEVVLSHIFDHRRGTMVLQDRRPSRPAG